MSNYLSQDFWVNYIGGPSVLLVFRQEDFYILAAHCPRECHIELSVREDGDPKVNANTVRATLP